MQTDMMIKHMRMKRLNRTPVMGFTLTEIAIVLSIIGFILGGIWAAASSVYSNIKVNQAEHALVTIAQNMRTLFGPSGSLTSGDLTATAIAAGVFPPDMLSGGVTVNPWNTTRAPNPNGITVASNTLLACSGGSSNFSIIFWDIPKSACAKLLMSVTGGGAAAYGLNCAYADGIIAANGTGVVNLDGSDSAIILSSCGGAVALGFSLQ